MKYIPLLVFSAGIVFAAPTVIERNIARHFGEPVPGEEPKSELMKRIEAFAEKTMASADVDTRLNGRKLGHALATASETGDQELAMLELLWRAKEAGMEVSAGDVAETVRQAAPEATPAKLSGKTQRPPAPEMAKWPSFDVRNPRSDIGDGWQVTYYNSNFIRLYYWGGSTNEFSGGLPGGTMRLRYFIPQTERDGWLEYELVENMDPRPAPESMASLEGYAPDPCYWLYEHERRDPVANPLPGNGVRKITLKVGPRSGVESESQGGEASIPVSYFGERRPYPHCTQGAMSGYPFPDKGDRWIYEFTIHPGDYLLQLPCTRMGFCDTWYVEAEYVDAKGQSHSAKVKLLWPMGSSQTELMMRDRVPFGEYTTIMPGIYERLRQKWEWGDDARFYNEFVKPVLDADAKLLERTRSVCGSTPKILGECDADRLKFYREIPRMVNITERIDNIRKDYLRALLEGRKPEPPKVKPGKTTQPAKMEDLEIDAPSMGDLELDEEVI